MTLTETHPPDSNGAAPPARDPRNDPETAVIGALIEYPARLDECGQLRAEHFYRPPHATIFRAVQTAYADRGLEATPVDVAQTLLGTDDGRALLVAQPAILADLIACRPPGAIGYYTRLTLQAWQERRGAEAIARAAQIIQGPGGLTAARQRLEQDLAELDTATTTTVNTWQPVDLEPVLNGTYEPPRATVGERADGVGLFYPGRQHTVASESESGKSWLALAAAATELARGNAVVYIDFEDDEGGVVGRLLALQVKPDDIRSHFAYLRPESPVSDPDLREALGDLHPTLAVIDGVTEGMVMHGLDPLVNKDAAQFGRILPGRIAGTGPAVASLDHVTKSTEGRGRYALGAVHKLNGLNGGAYILENRTPFGIGITGRSTIKIAKDRPAQLRRHGLPSASGMHWFGDLVMKSHSAAFAEVVISPPAERDPEFRPAHLMEKLGKLIAKHGPITGRKLQDIAKGNAPSNRQALTFLEVDGYITPTPHRLIRPYPPTPEETP